MDTVTKESTSTESDYQVMQQSLPAIFFPSAYYEQEGLSGYVVLKRVSDLIISLVLICTVLSWLYPILAVLIRLSSRGDTIFSQKRIGKNGKVFSCYKFRTMYVNDEADIKEAQLNDKRITGVGKLLRDNYLDELPQLINVLMGDMSLIGPRPHMLRHHYKFCAQVPSYDRRHQIKPGITGLSQVKGYHGSMLDSYGIHGRTKLDLFYIKKQSFKLDVMILIRTALIVFPFDKRSK